MAKEVAGMNFRNTYGFNLALLGKQDWNLLSNLGTMVSKLFKDKYYPKKEIHKGSLRWAITHRTLDVISAFRGLG